MILIDGNEFSVDHENSYIQAHLSPVNEDVSWELNVSAIEDDNVGDHGFEPPSINHVCVLRFDGTDWRTIANQHIQMEFETTDELEILLPDDPSTIYLGWHMSLNHHSIDIGDCDGNRINLDWNCRTNGDETYDVKIKSALEFKGVSIQYESLFRKAVETVPKDENGLQNETELMSAINSIEHDMPAALKLFQRHFNPKQFDEPDTIQWSVVFPVKPGEDVG